MKVLGGTLRGRNLQAPPGHGTRPVLARIREAYFDILGPSIQGAAVADFFAGSGSLGIEALSRGARHADFYESGPAARIIDQNLQSLGISDRGSVHRGSLPGSLRAGRSWDVLFVDPPWGTGLAMPALDAVLRHRLLSEHGEAIVRERWGEEVDEGGWLERGYELFDHRRYGDSAVLRIRPLPLGVDSG